MTLKALLLIFVLGIATYSLSFQNEFVFDDEEQVVNNSAIQNVSNIPSFFFTSTMNQGGTEKMGGIYYKPLMTTSYAVLWAIFGNNATPFHVFQVLLHCANSFLLFLFFCTFIAEIPALILALFFLLHPLNTENAVYVANFQDVLFSFFGLAALNLIARKKNSIGQTISISMLLLASLLSKETGVLFICSAAVYVFLHPAAKRIRFILAIAGSVIAYAFMRFGLAGLYGVEHGVAPISRASLAERFFTMPSALASYFVKLIAPLHLTTTQNWVVVEPSLVSFWLPFLFLIALAAAIAWLNYILDSKSLLFFSLILGGGLLLHSQLLAPLDGTTADRWFYFPMMAILGFIGLIFPWHKLTTKNLALVGGPILLLLAVRSGARSLDWKDGLTLYGHDIEIAPDSYDIQNNYGVELFRSGQPEAALPHFIRSTELAPHWTINWNNLGATYEKFGRLKEAEMAYCRSINNGVYYLALENYAFLLARTEQYAKSKAFTENIGLKALPQNQKLFALQKELQKRNIQASEMRYPLECL